MREITPKLFVGTQLDFESRNWPTNEWKIVQACKEPFHRKALSYTSRGAPKNDPEYLYAIRGNKLILNLVDSDDPQYIPTEVIYKAVEYIRDSVNSGFKVFIHCNKGESRSASIAMYYLYNGSMSFNDAEFKFGSLYPMYNPSNGIRTFLQRHWIK